MPSCWPVRPAGSLSFKVETDFISFINGSTGSVASFTTGSESYDDEELSFDISLTAVASAASEWSGYFNMTVPIDLEAY